MALISTKALSKTFQLGGEKIFALRDVSLEIQAGEFVAITGSSGSGKSTLLHILGLLDSPTSGHYVFDGTPTEGLSDDQRSQLRNQKLGFVFQRFHLLPRATALRNVMMPLLYAVAYENGLVHKDRELKARTALAQVGLADRVKHLPNELSGGESQRVAIARALVNNPRVLFADEPTGNLDSKNGEQIMQLFFELNRKGVTIIMVTHDQSLSARASRRVALHDGNIVQDSSKGPSAHVNS